MSEITHAKLLDEVLHHKPLASPPERHDRSAPHIEPGLAVPKFQPSATGADVQMLKEIEHGVPLKHVDPAEVHDASSPRIEDVVLHTSNRHDLLDEIKAVGGHKAVVSELKHTFLHEAREGGLPLHHVTTDDRSKPVVEGAHVGQWDKKGFLSEVKDPHWLNTVPTEQMHDRSAPKTHAQDGGPVLASSPPRGDLAKELARAGKAGGLHHVPTEEKVDRSAPLVSKTAAMRVVSGEPAGATA